MSPLNISDAYFKGIFSRVEKYKLHVHVFLEFESHIFVCPHIIWTYKKTIQKNGDIN